MANADSAAVRVMLADIRTDKCAEMRNVHNHALYTPCGSYLACVAAWFYDPHHNALCEHARNKHACGGVMVYVVKPC